eukprot:COSAG01_NODE_71023_length_257_cov_0.645570_1_plen_24_part_01
MGSVRPAQFFADKGLRIFQHSNHV